MLFIRYENESLQGKEFRVVFVKTIKEGRKQYQVAGKPVEQTEIVYPVDLLPQTFL